VKRTAPSPPSAADCKPYTDSDSNTLYNPFWLEAIQYTNWKKTLLAVSMSPNFDPAIMNRFRLESGGNAIFELSKGILTSHGANCGLVNLENSTYPFCGNSFKYECAKNQTWGVRSTCLPGEPRPTLVLVPLFNGELPRDSRMFHSVILTLDVANES
jgi:hypothetical protein